ncbi:MAG: response regulator transcription factor [Actinobacteria bacterium]|nr:response regulator transcription factor [Actinomycetota bacterium]
MEPEKSSPDDAAIAVLIVDDHAMVAESVAKVVNATPAMAVVGIATDAAEAQDAAARLEPDVVLMDYNLPSSDGVTCAVEMKARRPELRVLILTGYDTDDVVSKAINEGCDGFISKTAGVAEMVDAIRRANAGEAVFTVAELSRAVRRLRRSGGPTELSDRELDVLRLMASGASTADLASELYISVHTVRSHVRHILEKLGAHSKLEAVSIALREGIISMPSSN